MVHKHTQPKIKKEKKYTSTQEEHKKRETEIQKQTKFPSSQKL